MTSTAQERADAANDSYANRSKIDIDKNAPVTLDGKKYQVFGYANDHASGFHATAYQKIGAPHNIIIAYRGTDPGLFSGKTNAEKLDHALTTVQDAVADATMVRDAVNLQKGAADAFTQAMIDKAARQGIGMDRIFVTGHSLGGTLAEIEAAKYGLTGSTYNAFGAAGLLDGPPKPGFHLTNYRMAGDVVSAASRQVGEVVTLASPDDLERLRVGRYIDAPHGSRPNPFLAMNLGDHGVTNFVGPDSVLKPAVLAQYEKNYTDNKSAIDAYGSDLSHDAAELFVALKLAQAPALLGLQGLPPDLRQHLDEYLAINVDPLIHKQIDQNPVVTRVEHRLHESADLLLEATHEQKRRSVLETTMDAVANRGLEQAAGNQLLAESMLKLATHELSQLAVSAMHSTITEAAVLKLANRGIDLYRVSEVTGRVVEQDVAAAGVAVGAVAIHGVKAAEQAVGQRMDSTAHAAVQSDAAPKPAVPGHADAADHAAGHAGDTLSHLGQWFQHEAAAGSAPSRAQAVMPAGSNHPRNDPRHPDNPRHALYETLERRIPEASQNRLLQFTAACHEQGISDTNIGRINYLEDHGLIQIQNRGIGPPAEVDVNAPPPQARQSIQQIQQADQHLAQLQVNIQQPSGQQHIQGRQGLMPDGGPR